MLDQVGVPKSISLTLTFPERVTDFNKAQMQKLIDNGPDEHPGAKYIVRPPMMMAGAPAAS